MKRSTSSLLGQKSIQIREARWDFVDRAQRRVGGLWNIGDKCGRVASGRRARASWRREVRRLEHAVARVRRGVRCPGDSREAVPALGGGKECDIQEIHERPSIITRGS